MINLSLILIIATLFGSPRDTHAALRVWAIGDGVRVDPVSGELIEGMQAYFGPVVDGNPKEQNWVWDVATATISLKAARNEVVACQIIVEVDQPINGINIQSTELIGPGGHRLQSANIALFRQWYHFVPYSTAPRQGVRYPLKTGWYPDALIPFDAANHGAPFNIPGEDFYSINESGEPVQKLDVQTNQAVWVDVYVPDDTPPGYYQGYLNITAENEQAQKVKLQLEVFDFKIPDEFHTTMELTEYYRIAEGPEDLELKTYRLTQQHRITIASPGLMPDVIGLGYDVKLDWERFDSRWGKFFDGSAFVEGPGKGQPITQILLPFDARVWRPDKTPKWWGKNWPFPLPGDSIDQKFTLEYDKAFSKKSLGFRTWQWIVWKYRLSGANDWEFGLTQGKNIFRQTIISESEGYPYLRNMYVYPGEQIGLAGEPLPSIRLKMIRRGLQDYEYFWLLTEKNKDGGEAADKVVNRIVRRGLREAVPLWPPRKYDPTNWSHRPAEWYNARLELASLIEDTPRNITHEIMPGYKVGRLLASESFSGNLDDWLTEGKVITRIDRGQLYMESFDTEIENPKGNIWWKNDFENPYVIEFDYQSLSDNGLTMVFWNAFGLDGKDVFSWERTGKYEEYVNSNLTAYHCSFHRFKTGLSNIRKAPGFHLVSSVKDPVGTESRRVHKIMVASAGNRQRIFVDGQLVHDFIDESKPCMNEHNWQHPLPCRGTGSIPAHGAFGIRLTQKQKAKFDNIKAFRLNKKVEY